MADRLVSGDRFCHRHSIDLAGIENLSRGHVDDRQESDHSGSHEMDQTIVNRHRGTEKQRIDKERNVFLILSLSFSVLLRLCG